MNWLLIAAEAVAIFHIPILYPLSSLIGPLEYVFRKRVGGMVFSIILGLVTFPSQWLFSNDCPLRLFEFCLRGLGGETFDLHRFHTMEKLLGVGLAPMQIYNLLLLRTGLYVLAMGIAMIVISVLADHRWQKVMRQTR